jgi:hypothetical protein
MITEYEYSEWLSSDDALPVIIVEATHSDGVVYVSNAAFVSDANDVPAHTTYEDVLIGDVDINSRIDSPTKSFGTLLLSNDGELTPWIDLFWRGFPLKVYIGDESWSRNDFRLVFDGINGGINIPAADRLEWTVYDYSEKLNVNIGSDTSPLSFGQLFNVDPVLIDSALLKYKVHSGAVESIIVKDNGVVITPTINLDDGEFTLLAQPAGRITVDVVQFSKSTVQMVTAICAMINVGVDADNLALFSNNTALGFYIKTPVNVASIISEILSSVGATSLFDHLGQLQIYRLEAPTLPTLFLAADDIERDGLRLLGIEQPTSTMTMGYLKNWAVQDQSSVAGSLTAAQSQSLAKEYLTVDVTNNSDNHPLAQDERVNTLIADVANAQVECQRRATLRATRRRLWSAKCYLSASQVHLGQTVNVTYPDFGFDDGENVVVVGINRFINDRTLELTLWQ